MKKFKLVAIEGTTRKILGEVVKEYPTTPKKLLVLRLPHVDFPAIRNIQQSLLKEVDDCMVVFVANDDQVDLELYEIENE